MFNKSISEVNESLIRYYNNEVKKYKDGISLAIGEPFAKVDNNVIDSLKKSLDRGEYKYINAAGDKELIRAIALKHNIEEDNILITNGSSEGVFISLLALINEGEEVILFNPVYPQYEPVISFVKGVVKFIDYDENFEPNIDDFKNKISTKTKVIIINSPSNPSGKIYSNIILKTIEEVCLKNNIIIISDDVYEDIKYLNFNEYKLSLPNTIFLKSFSKTYGMTGFRLGYIIAEKSIIKQLTKVHSYLNISVPQFIQKSGVKALENGCCNINNYSRNLNYIYKVFKKNNIRYIEVDGGIFIMFNVSELGIDDKLFCDILLDKYHVAAVPGNAFNLPGYIRINFCIKYNILVKGLKRIVLLQNRIRAQ